MCILDVTVIKKDGYMYIKSNITPEGARDTDADYFMDPDPVYRRIHFVWRTDLASQIPKNTMDPDQIK